jgi:hypothetical protein
MALCGKGHFERAEGGRMTTRHDLVKDMEDAETILLALDGLREDIPDKTVIRAIVRCLWHILEYLLRRADK